jgi:CreA protein
MNRRFVSIFTAAMLAWGGAAMGEEVGHVDTAFKFLGANHKIVVEAFDDPKIDGVTCFLSMARTGGISGSLGLADDPSVASIACRQVGPITFTKAISLDEEGERVFKTRQSVLFKKLQVVRFLDKRRNTLIYLAFSDKLIDGSPQNAISAVAMMPWGDQAPGKPLAK